MLKRTFDIVVSTCGLIIFGPFFLIFAILIKLDSKGPALFMQERHTLSGRLFKMHKFRSMYMSAHHGSQLTAGNNDIRITRCGRIIRKLHLDETIQLIDVLLGNMSIVGPRPEVPQYLSYYKQDWEKVFKVKSGITGLASIRFDKKEYDILCKSSDKNKDYIERILPSKLRYEKFYVAKQSFLFDLKILYWTVCYFIKEIKDSHKPES